MVTTQPSNSYTSTQTLDLLLSRLSWPSALAAERACTALGALLVHPAHSVETEEALLRWIDQQNLESVACRGLLPVKQAQIRGATLKRSLLERLTTAIRPSFLSWLLLSELADRALAAPDWTKAFSGSAPPDYETDADFLKSMAAFSPTMYREWAARIESTENIPFFRQWAFERHRILGGFVVKPSEDALKFQRTSDGERHAILDFPMAEVYRSGFLRALAWAHHAHSLDRGLCFYLAASVCPLDLDLWRVRPDRRPGWWPTPPAAEGALDTVPGAVWSKLEEHLLQHRSDGGHPWVLTQAWGPVLAGAAKYDLAVWGIFQRCLGPTVPEPETLAGWCQARESLRCEGPSPLRMQGRAPVPRPEEEAERFADWQVAPCAHPVQPRGFPRWQWWMLSRPFWLPSSLLGQGETSFRADAAGIEASQRGTVVGKGIIWIDALDEMIEPPIPPATGQALLTKRSLLLDHARASGWTFCWVCQLTAFVRQERYEP